MGRLTRDPDVRSTQNGDGTESLFARYSLAVDRDYKSGKDNEQQADFFNCVVFGKRAEFAQKFLHKGTKIVVVGRLQTGSYTGTDGIKRNTTDIVVQEHHFCESRNAQSNDPATPTTPTDPNPSNAANVPGPDGFMSIPDGIEEELPFN